MTPPSTASAAPSALLDRVAAAAIAEGIADAVFTRMDSPIGRLLVAQSAQGVCRIAFEHESEELALGEVARALGPRVVSSAQDTLATREALLAYLEGDSAAADLPVDLCLTRGPFQRDVLAVLRQLAPGETTTYTGLAQRAGRPRATRAAGTACGRNPVPLIVPCHRVLPLGGGVGGYRGGPEVKRRLLALEGVAA